jgi:FAD/FMN-containing dehydrogenase
MTGIDACLADLAGLAIETQPQKVRRRSRDYYWYSPILKQRLDHVTADAVVTPQSEAEVIQALAAAHAHRVPVTARGGGTGNYGQAMPLQGGIVLDLSAMAAIREIRPGSVRAEAGAKLAAIDEACRASGQELRFHPSTLRTGTIGGYVAGGSSGVGSITWGLLRDPGNILMARVVTMEAQPRVLELRGPDIQKVNHAYGTNGVITELAMPLAPAYRWSEQVLAFPDVMAAARFADRFARQDGMAKKLATVLAAPIGHDYLMPDLCAPGESLVLVMVAAEALEVFGELGRQAGARLVRTQLADERPAREPPLFEYTWNHTTLHALKVDKSITYLQTLFPPPGHLALVEAMAGRFGDEVPMHLEFVRYGGEVACFGLQLVRYRDEARLQAIMAAYNQAGCPIFNPHDHTLEGGGMKKVDRLQLAFKREADPLGLLNPGKMIGWDDPAYDESADRRFLYDAGEVP